jgi:hypothetical protein
MFALGTAGSAQAVVFSFSGPSNSSGDPLAATAEFQVSGTSLTIILTNTQTGPSTDGNDVLDGLFFNINGDPTLSNGMAALTAGSGFEKKDGAAASGNPLNDEWMFDTSISSLNRMYGIGSTGFPDFNRNQETFTEVFHGGSAAAGANSDYGIVPQDGIVVGSPSNVYVNNSVTFSFTLSSAISESDISNVLVTYGSSGTTQLVPEPATLGALAIGAVALLRRRRR